MGVLVENLTDEHVEEAVELLRSTSPHVGAGIVPYDSDRFGSFARSASTLPERLRTIFFRALVEDGRLIAVADWRLSDAVLFLSGVAVTPEARGAGLGKGMVKDGLRLAKRWQCVALELDVPRDNERALCLYDAMGFVARDGVVWSELPRRGHASARNGSPSVPAPAQLADVPDLSAPQSDEPELPWRILNWPIFTAMMSAYGFGQLKLASPHQVRSTPADAVTIEVLPGGWRVSGIRDADTAWEIADALGDVVGGVPSRLFTVVEEGSEPPPSSIRMASFRRLRRGRRRTTEGSAIMTGMRR